MDYSLQVFQNIKLGNALFEQDIAPIAKNWRRSTRLNGGYWLGSFTIDYDRDEIIKWYDTYLAARIVETVGNHITWEGLIYEMTLDDTVVPATLKVKTAGYAHTLNWRFTSSGDGNTADLSTWLNTIVTTDCEFITDLRYVSNTLSVVQDNEMKKRAWDELSRLVAMGDSGSNLHKLYVTAGQRLVYTTVNSAPAYFVNGGLIRRKSLDDMYNYIGGDYIDENDEVQELTPVSHAGSTAIYGRKEYKLVENNVPQASIEKMQAVTLNDSAYPWSRVISCMPDIKFYDVGNNIVHPRFVEPAVVRDLSFNTAGVEYGSYFDDVRDFLMDEVEVYTDENGNTNLALRTADTNESDLLEAWYKEIYAARDDGSNSSSGKDHKGRENVRGTKEYHDKRFGENYWDEDQLDWWKEKGYDWTYHGWKDKKD